MRGNIVSKPETLMIDDIKYVRADAVPAAPGEVKLVVLDRGFVYVGRASQEGDYLVIRNAKNIRYWGTSKGLGELVNGPLSGTKMDVVGTVRAPLRAVISIIDAVDSKWTGI
jgi:hypothetical protein